MIYHSLHSQTDLLKRPRLLQNHFGLSRESILIFLLAKIAFVNAIYDIFNGKFFFFFLLQLIGLLLWPFIAYQLLTHFNPSLKSLVEDLKSEKVSQYKSHDVTRKLKALCYLPANHAKLVSLLIALHNLACATFFCSIGIFQTPIYYSSWKLFAIILFSICYLYAATYYDSHYEVSKTIDSIHKKFDWSLAFSKFNFSEIKSAFVFVDFVAIVGSWIAIFILQAVLLLNYINVEEKETLTFELISIAFVGLVSMIQILFLSRQYVYGGLHKLAKVFESNPLKNKPLPNLAIHSVPLLGQLEQTLNAYLKKINQNELELKKWILKTVEKRRFETLGEISNLILHDISTPVQLTAYCIELLKTRIDRSHNAYNYIAQLEQAHIQIQELTISLRSYLKGGHTLQKVNLNEVYRYVQNIINIKYYEKGIRNVSFMFEDSLKKCNLYVSKPDLIYVALNIVTQYIEIFFEKSIKDPVITFKQIDKQSFAIEASCADSSYLDFLKVFEQEFSEKLLEEENTSERSLNLISCRSLLNQYGGNLQINPLIDNFERENKPSEQIETQSSELENRKRSSGIIISFARNINFSI